jgi:hypothetical protein
MQAKASTIKKKIPSYWWDFEGENKIIVESDDDRFPVVAIFIYDPINGGVEAQGDMLSFCKENGLETRIGQAGEAINKAENYILDLNSGRVNPRKLKVS